MLEEHKGTLLRSVRARLDEARRILAFVELERGDAELVCTLINVADLAVADCMPDGPKPS